MMSDMYQNASVGPDGGRDMLVGIATKAFRDIARIKLFEEFPALEAERKHQEQQKIEAKTGKSLEELLEGY